MWRKIIDDYRLYYLNDFFEIKWISYGLSRMLQFSQFVWRLSYSALDVINNFLLIHATNRSKISSDQKRFYIALSLSLSFFANKYRRIGFYIISYMFLLLFVVKSYLFFLQTN